MRVRTNVPLAVALKMTCARVTFGLLVLGLDSEPKSSVSTPDRTCEPTTVSVAFRLKAQAHDSGPREAFTRHVQANPSTVPLWFKRTTVAQCRAPPRP